MKLFGFFSGLGRLLKRALTSATVRGLTDVVIQSALGYAKQAAVKFTDNAERREWAVAQVQRRCHVPEVIARMAVEMAVQLLKDEVAAKVA